MRRVGWPNCRRLLLRVAVNLISEACLARGMNAGRRITRGGVFAYSMTETRGIKGGEQWNALHRAVWVRMKNLYPI